MRTSDHAAKLRVERRRQWMRRRVNQRIREMKNAAAAARMAGREVVGHCRQSDVETLEWVLREVMVKERR